MHSFKEEVYHAFESMLYEKINEVRSTLADLRESAANETKSTAGDKYETALAMLQIEQANTARQLDQLLIQKKALDTIVLSSSNCNFDNIIPGSLVSTSHGCLFLSAALGKVIVQGQTVTAVSPQSPLGKLLMGKKVDDMAELLGKRYVVLEIL